MFLFATKDRFNRSVVIFIMFTLYLQWNCMIFMCIKRIIYRPRHVLSFFRVYIGMICGSCLHNLDFGQDNLAVLVFKSR